MSDATILIVDDEEELRENLFDLLEFKGYRVLKAASGEEALEMLASNDVDLALLDIQLPGMSGLDVLQEIRKSKPTMPVAMVSASSVRSILAKAEEYGANRVVLKPYSQMEILRTVEELLASRSTT